MVAGPLRPLRLRPPSPAPRYQPPVPAAATPLAPSCPGDPRILSAPSRPLFVVLSPLGRSVSTPACAMYVHVHPRVPEPPSSLRRTSALPPSTGWTEEGRRVSWHDNYPRKARPGLLSTCLPPLARIFYSPTEWTESTADFRSREKKGESDRRVSVWFSKAQALPRKSRHRRCRRCHRRHRDVLRERRPLVWSVKRDGGGKGTERGRREERTP